MAPTLIQLLERHHTQSWGWSLACCDWQHALAEDALQEAYLRVLDGRARFGGRSSEKTWFFGVIKHVAAEQRRKHARQGLLQVFYRHRAANEPAVEAAPDLELDQSSQALRQALMELPARQREILHLVFYSDLSLAEAATAAGISVGSARTHYHRGKQRLQQLLDEQP
ncbi:RNA polymerase sigma factor [Halieaceae bacterium IMCC14734]|uniref:RNA polymerase sigma factor n=1 Tax=Candidatus Litorirhabdus singularis TaxID=2518993 RepID=A0ABT3TDW3_9GAMM|nr:RNA polymerase sigma factor [Candidatus Litorirhabdus singularis]MCX2980503.1 RNA polymerase sigma factor [Candidatus Litorirhabdus singularis]